MKICPKIFKIVLTGLIAFVIFSIANVAKSRAVIRIPDDVPGPPYVLDQAGEAYILTQDISVPGTAITIAVSGITLNLNGHTITYNTVAGDQKHGVANVDDKGTVYWNLNNIHVTNGSLVQGAGKGYQSDAVYFRENNEIEADHLTISYEGDDTEGVHINGGGGPGSHGALVHDNIIRPNGTKRVLTHYGGFAAINVGALGGRVEIYDNDIQGKGYSGINFGYSTPLSSTLKITGNTIKMDTPVRDGYAISIASPNNEDIGFEIANNTIIQISGRGILINGFLDENSPGPGNGTIHDNYIDVREAHDAYEYNAPGSSTGICLRFGAHNIKVYNNTVKAWAGKNVVQTSFTFNSPDCIARALKIHSGKNGKNIEVYKNIVEVNTTDAYLTASGIYAISDTGVSAENTVFHDNTVTSNSIIVDLNSDDGSANYVTLRSNTFIKGANPLGFHSIRAGYWTGQSIGNVFLDNRWENGASKDDVLLSGSGGANYSLYTKWYLDVTAKDQNGQTIAGASVSASATAGAAETVAAVTDSTGKARLELTEFYRYGMTYPPSSNYNYYTPHTITVSKDGFETATQEITMDASKSLTVTLISTSINNPTFASDLTGVKVYPNPCRGDRHSQIIFDNLTANVRIKIYTPTGELVREINEQVGDKAYWDLKNRNGEKVTSGTYIYHITNPKSQEKKGKIVIIK